jgi:chromodomain protein Y
MFYLLQANEMLLGGRKLTAIEAYQNNLVSQVYWPTSMMQEVIPKVESMANQSAKVMYTMYHLFVFNPSKTEMCQKVSKNWIMCSIICSAMPIFIYSK